MSVIPEENMEVDFFENIKKEIESGATFVGLFGSGISYQSGIMLGSQIVDYLSFVYWSIFEDKKMIRDFSSQGWPIFKKNEIPKVKEYIKNRYESKKTHQNNSDLISKINDLIVPPLCPEVLRHTEKSYRQDYDEKIKLLNNLNKKIDVAQTYGIDRFPISDQ